MERDLLKRLKPTRCLGVSGGLNKTKLIIGITGATTFLTRIISILSRSAYPCSYTLQKYFGALNPKQSILSPKP